ncbi:MAG TPA: YceK/YidQ family lipoprotein [Planctomycetaceae bacterium]
MTELVYGGVKFDAESIRLGLTSKDVPLSSRLLALAFIADIPISAVCDTLQLPLTIPAARNQADKRRKAHEMKWADFDDEGNQSPVEPVSGNSDVASGADEDVWQQSICN